MEVSNTETFLLVLSVIFIVMDFAKVRLRFNNNKYFIILSNAGVIACTAFIIIVNNSQGWNLAMIFFVLLSVYALFNLRTFVLKNRHK